MAVLLCSCFSQGTRCISGQIERVGDVPVRGMLGRLGGWPVLTGSWNEVDWHLEHVLAQTRGHFNTAVFLRSLVAVDDKNSSNHILQVVPPVSNSHVCSARAATVCCSFVTSLNYFHKCCSLCVMSVHKYPKPN